ncbi:MAG: hypothetical protein RH946_03705 [Rhodospirillales bacterium]
MRDRPQLTGFESLNALRAQWLCLIAEHILGVTNLSVFDVLTTGFGSIYDHPVSLPARTALWNLRLMGIDVSQRRGVRRAVNDCLEWEDEHRLDPGYVEPPYEIDTRDPYPFVPRLSPTDPIISEMLAAITQPLGYRSRNYSDGDMTRAASVNLGTASFPEPVAIDLAALPPLPPPSYHDLARAPRGAIGIPLADLVKLAEELDKIDGANPERRPGNWLNRLIDPTTKKWKFDVLAPVGAKLTPQTKIDLDGLKHMLGLPGAGKTTLIMLVLMWMARHGYRAAVLLPSIETSLNLLSDLRFYGADVGLMVGQSPETRLNHADRLAERLASLGQNHGFGTTMVGADLLGINCPLDAYRSGPNTENPAFRHTDPPCIDLKQKKTKKNGSESEQEATLRCPVSSWCGRMRAPRQLTDHSIWLGHIHSSDTVIQPHFLEHQESIRYFEMIARTMDLVIVDEADGAQAALDQKSVVSLDITGSKDSMEKQIIDDLVAPMTEGRNFHTGSNVQNYNLAVTRFRVFNAFLTHTLQLDYATQDKLLVETYSGRFITGNSILGVLFMPENLTALSLAQREKEEDRVERIREFWDDAVRAALTEADPNNQQFEMNIAAVAGELKKTEGEVEQAARDIAAGLRLWLNSDEIGRRKEFEALARDALLNLVPPAGHQSAAETVQHFSMLMGVTMVVSEFRLLSMAQRSMVSEGIHQTQIAGTGSSADLVTLMPEAVIGRFSGVRVSFEGEDQGRKSLRLQYLSFTGAPRILLYRWHELFRREGVRQGPNVLLTSATSFLEQSPSYHINIGPDIVLRAKGGMDEWKRSEWHLQKIPDPDNKGKPIRFSGSKLSRREIILRHMIDHYYAGASPRVEKMLEDFDKGRRIAFVVNSYEQVAIFKEYLKRRYPALGERTIGVTKRVPKGAGADWVVASQVEHIGGREDWDAIVFPMKSLSRGVNIVFPSGTRRNDAVIGTIVFLTRPHPAADNLDLVTGVVGCGTLNLEQKVIAPAGGFPALKKAWESERFDTMATVRRLLRFPIIASMLGPHMEPFTADVMIDVLQTIGRGMRNGKKVRVYFADAAWAPNSFADNGKNDSPYTSMLISIRDILRKNMMSSNPIHKEVYRALYEPFLAPLEKCTDLKG